MKKQRTFAEMIGPINSKRIHTEGVRFAKGLVKSTQGKKALGNQVRRGVGLGIII